MTKRYRRADEDIAAEGWTSPWTPTEDEFTDLFLSVAKKLGWQKELRYHARDSRRTNVGGFPDWVLVHVTQRRVLFVELKGFGGKPSEEQLFWLEALDRVGAEAYLVTTAGDYAQDAAALAELLRVRPRRAVT